jgi:hypothetical protein
MPASLFSSPTESPHARATSKDLRHGHFGGKSKGARGLKMFVPVSATYHIGIQKSDNSQCSRATDRS